MKHVPALFTLLCALAAVAGCYLGPTAAPPALPTPMLLPTPVVPTLVPPVLSLGEKPALPAPVSTAETYPTSVPSPPLLVPTPRPLWDLHSLLFNASVAAEAEVIGSEKRTGSYTFIFYVHEWYKNERGVKDNTLRLTLDTTRNWDKLAYLPRNLIGSDTGPYPFRFILFLGGDADHYFILGDTAGIFFLREGMGLVNGVETGAGAEQYQNMPVQAFKAALLAALPATPTALPATATPLPTPADGSPISLVKVGDSYEVYVHRGVVRLGVGGMPAWLGPSRLLALWSSSEAPYEDASYAVDVQSGTIEKYSSTSEWYAPYGSVPHPDGKRALLLIGATEDIWRLTYAYYDRATKKEQTVYDRDASMPQWAGAEVHEPGVALSPSTPIWLSDEMFILPLGPSMATGEPQGKGKLLLVSTRSHKVRLLVKNLGSAGYCSCDYGMPLLYQKGGITGPLLMLRAPYTGTPVTLTAGGPWIRDWTATPDGHRVAWVEAAAPPGDWSQHLPSPCIPCEGPGRKDPEPQVRAIAIWDSATGKVYRHTPSGLVWTLGSAYFTQWTGGLHWRADGSALLYATHTSGSPGRSSLYSLTPGNKPVLVAEDPWDGSIYYLGEGKDGSIYYWVTGRQYYASGDLVRRHQDGRLEVLHENLTANMWWVDTAKRLEVLQEGTVAIYDFATGSTRHAHFFDDSPSPNQLGWSSVQDLVPLSPNGEWAAYAGTNSDAIEVRPDGTPDRGTKVQIVRVK